MDSIKKPYQVDVPVKLNIWTRPECQRKQFDVIKTARPSILFLQSDGGRNDKEWEAICKNRKIFDEEIDWDCTVYKLYEDSNRGLYAMHRKSCEFIWEHVDRCIFLEDDQIPSVSFFSYCAELLERYKDDERVMQICGHNIFEEYPAAEPNSYFFAEVGWSIWGLATWKRAFSDEVYPLPYADDEYIKKCLKDNLPDFWCKKVDGYCKGELVNNHVPGPEYFNAINSALFHRLSIIPTKNMICNIGVNGVHAQNGDKSTGSLFNQKTYEISVPLIHPKYIIDDKAFGKRYAKKLYNTSFTHKLLVKIKLFFNLLFHGKSIRGVLPTIKKSQEK